MNTPKNIPSPSLSFTEAASQSARIRQLYHQLESRHHAEPWSKQEDMIGFLYDIGELGRLLMAVEGRWQQKDDAKKQFEEKMAECLWWLFALSDRCQIDIDKVFKARLDELEGDLSKSVENL